MKKLITALFLQFCLVLNAGVSTDIDYYGPTEQLIKRESWERIESKLNRMKISNELIPFFDSIAAQESWGHLGYHGTNQQFRIYQDIIRFTMEEIVSIPIRSDFQFLRIPGDPDLNLKTCEEFFDYWGKKVDNKSELRAKQLLSLNFGMYSNFDVEGSCSVMFFARDISKTKIDYSKFLNPFYNKLGIPLSDLKALFAIAKKWLDDDAGVLLQVSENSHLTDLNQEAFNLADILCYPAKKGGFVHGTRPISIHYGRILSDIYVNSDVDIAPQLRLIISNKTTLNPYSQLSIKRFDSYSPETIKGYEAEMKEYIRNMTFSEEKTQKYRDNLLNTWL
jgi:hypothetical protein